MHYDLIIRGGTIVDGSGRNRFEGDIGITNGVIACVGDVGGSADEVITAHGKLVTPGFVDIHTHYDGQVTWSQQLSPSTDHGVTTVVMGNCGVGFAPCRPDDRTRLVRLMEGVEDIPEVVLSTGLPWTWETFPEFLDHLDTRTFDADVATYIPHAPLRVYVMGDRAAAREPATKDDIAAMQLLAREAMDRGAIGFSTSRSLNHRASDGSLTPSYATESDELAGIAGALKDAGTGVLQMVSDYDDVAEEFSIIRRMASESGRPVTLSLLQTNAAPTRWKSVLAEIEKANANGLEMSGQSSTRPVGILMGLALCRNPFNGTAAYREIATLDPADRAAAMREPARREAILSQFPGDLSEAECGVMTDFERIFDYDAEGYEPSADRSVAALARHHREMPAARAYDMLARGDGGTILFFAGANYADTSIEPIETMLNHPHVVIGLGDGGAHCGLICDASQPTYYLERWSEIGKGTIRLEDAIRRLTSETAAIVGLRDRGMIAEGYRADLNVIDAAKLQSGRPEAFTDLPAGGSRLGQKASGYDATIVAGHITYRDGVHTGALPGRLVRGARDVPPGSDPIPGRPARASPIGTLAA